MKTYKWFRGLLKASAFATVMFVMQACYGAPHPMEDPNYNDEAVQSEPQCRQLRLHRWVHSQKR